MRRIAIDALVALGFFVLMLQAFTLLQSERLFRRGQNLESEGQYDLAQVKYRLAMEYAPDRFELLRAMGSASFKSYQPGSRNYRPLFMAESSLSSAAALNPRYPYGWHELGEAMFRLRQDGASKTINPERYFRRALEIDPQNPIFLAALLRWQLASGLRASAWETFIALIDSNPSAILVYGNHLAANENDLERLIDATRGDTGKTVNLARLIYGRKDFARAEQLLRQLPPDSQIEPEVASLLAATLRQQGRMDAAEKALADALAHDPENLYLVRDLGWLLTTAKKKQEAMELFRREVKAHPDQIWLSLEAANAARQLGEYDSAADWFQVALVNPHVNPNQTRDALIGLAAVRQKQGQLRAALIAYERLLENEPGNNQYKKMVEKLQAELDRQP